MIDSYKFGEMEIDGVVYKSDLMIFQGHVTDNWWRAEGHSLCLDDLKPLLKTPPETLVVGTGADGMVKVPVDLIKELATLGVETIAIKTGEAWQEYNRLAEKNRDVAGAFHLTC